MSLSDSVQTLSDLESNPTILALPIADRKAKWLASSVTLFCVRGLPRPFGPRNDSEGRGLFEVTQITESSFDGGFLFGGVGLGGVVAVLRLGGWLAVPLGLLVVRGVRPRRSAALPLRVDAVFGVRPRWNSALPLLRADIVEVAEEALAFRLGCRDAEGGVDGWGDVEEVRLRCVDGLVD